MELHNTKIDIPKEIREKVIAILNQRLADAVDLKSQAKQAHWNVKGPNFIALHELFDQVAAEVDTHVDDIAERITTLGGVAMGTVRLAAKSSSLSESQTGPLMLMPLRPHWRTLVKRYVLISTRLIVLTIRTHPIC